MEAATAAPPAEPLDGEDPQDQPEPVATVEGTNNQLGWDVGGDEPLASEMTIRGGKVTVDGDFKKGEHIDLHVRVRIAEVTFADKYDGATGEVVDTVRRHVGKIVRLERA